MTVKKAKRARVRKPVAPQKQSQKPEVSTEERLYKEMVYLLEVIVMKLDDTNKNLNYLVESVKRNR